MQCNSILLLFLHFTQSLSISFWFLLTSSGKPTLFRFPIHSKNAYFTSSFCIFFLMRNWVRLASVVECGHYCFWWGKHILTTLIPHSCAAHQSASQATHTHSYKYWKSCEKKETFTCVWIHFFRLPPLSTCPCQTLHQNQQPTKKLTMWSQKRKCSDEKCEWRMKLYKRAKKSLKFYLCLLSLLVVRSWKHFAN